jgi:hypothetical protein
MTDSTAGTSDRRTGERASLMTEVAVSHGAGNTTTTSLDVSTTGISVWGPSTPPTGAIRLDLAVEDEPLTLQGHVVRQFRSDGGAVWGIEFFDTDPLATLSLTKYVAANAA